MAALVGATGGAAIEAVDIIKSIRWHRQLPWNVRPETVDPPARRPDVRPGEESLPAPGWAAYAVSVVLRLFVSGALTGAMAGTFPASVNPLMAFVLGLGALSAVQQAATIAPLVVKNAGRAALGTLTDEPAGDTEQWEDGGPRHPADRGGAG